MSAGGSLTRDLGSLKLLHITKCAGTALECWALHCGLKWGRRWHAVRDGLAAGLKAPHQGRLKSEWWHVPPRFFIEDPYAGYSTFTVVRCPYRRAISEFRCPWKGFKAPTGKDDARKRLRTAATATEMNSWLRAKLLSGASTPPFRNGHWIPQHFYIVDEAGRRRVPESNVLRMETLSMGFKEMLARHGHSPDAELASVNESEMPRFSLSDLLPETRRMIQDCYAGDFDLLSYER